MNYVGTFSPRLGLEIQEMDIPKFSMFCNQRVLHILYTQQSLVRLQLAIVTNL